MGAPRVPPAWLSVLQSVVLEQSMSTQDLQPAVRRIVEALAARGLDPERLSISILTVHPGLSGLAYVWRRFDDRVEFFERPWGFLDSEEHQQSPVNRVVVSRERIFIQTPDLLRSSEFSLLASFAAEGATSYLALPVPSVRGDTHVLALWTARAGGWSEEEASDLSLLVPLFSTLVELNEGRRLLGLVGAAHEVTQRVMAEQALRNADVLMRQQAESLARLEAERAVRERAERQLEERTRALAESNRELTALSASLEDKVTARTAELAEALDRAKAAAQAKSRFLAMMSHEIRTPLHGVMAVAELLRRSSMDAEQQAYVDILLETGQTLLRMLNDVLDLSKSESGHLEVEKVRYQPGSLVEDLFALFHPLAVSKGIYLRREAAPDVPVEVLGDPLRVRQILTNAIENAIKFTEVGGVLVTLDRAVEEECSSLRFTVQDTGVGIAEEVMSRLFQPFSQADSSTTRRYGGTGLGLAICQRLATAMGGTCSMDSALGSGSRFSLVIPFRDAGLDEGSPERSADPTEGAMKSAAAPQAGAPQELASVLRELVVLVVDDNPINRLITDRQLTAIGLQRPFLAESGVEALEILHRHEVDVVFMDMQMPWVDGLETTRQLRRAPLARQPRVIAMTANAFAEDRRACKAAGMDDFLAKPVSIDALAKALQTAVEAG